ncbi:hypothetical protein [Kineosporia sp. NBRC 101731]|uniref:hypothetical protein n=1 Tax=Kineosporia sp. NBRC 101731 TaxID=3032199 RepID=UPI0024A02D8A|nr:hypothetical protein [Kineosporia sp. NBRC 101731]GLY29078.1 hypothetical protein Kisp02_24430 [Kineosporia sp. NBRC 101731]
MLGQEVAALSSTAPMVRKPIGFWRGPPGFTEEGWVRLSADDLELQRSFSLTG